MPRPVEFWFEFASTYSYLSAMRIEKEAERRGVETLWRPFLLGPIFAEAGWNDSPFNVYPNKGRYMHRDMTRLAKKYGLEYNFPKPGDTGFPRNSVLAARMALVALKEDWGREFCQRVFAAEFVQGADIADEELLASLARDCGAHTDIVAEATRLKNKTLLRVNTDRAVELGIFGAPSFVVGEELFWGNDRLEDALDWAMN